MTADETEANWMSPLVTKQIFLGSFIGSQLLLAFIFFRVKPEKYESMIEEQRESAKFQAAFAQKANDPKRPPWALLHLHVTEMREGKRKYDGLGKIWEQVKHWHNGCWLIPVEITQILKYTTGKFMSNYVEDPESFRKELITQLENIKRGKVYTIDPITREVQEIINVALAELNEMEFRPDDEIPLVPTHTK